MTQERTTALQAACLAATLVTAFAAAPAQASTGQGPEFTTSTGTPVYDASYVIGGGSPLEPISKLASGPANGLKSHPAEF